MSQSGHLQGGRSHLCCVCKCKHSNLNYDNKKKGEVDFLVDDHDNLTVLPLEIKSGKDYTDHSALSKFLETPDYGINHAIVFSNEREIFRKKGVTYLPIYYIMFLHNEHREEPVILPELEAI